MRADSTAVCLGSDWVASMADLLAVCWAALLVALAVRTVVLRAVSKVEPKASWTADSRVALTAAMWGQQVVVLSAVPRVETMAGDSAARWARRLVFG